MNRPGSRPGPVPLVLAAGWLVLWSVCAVSPASREVWWAENIPVMMAFAALAATYRRFRFSDAAYLFMAAWLYLHTIGGHYTFAQVPFGFVTDLFGFSRNHFDRMAHFSIGFYAFAVAEWAEGPGRTPRPVAMALGLTTIMAVAGGYEVIEWWFAVLAGGDAGPAFLGSQGDVWDAQKDILADTLGAICSLAAYLWLKGRAGA